ncbi:uncharacterized protein C9orf85 homolog [Trichonephila inaurata madagascariensis]|uniref:Uncharacterized protein C9orf85 homolog n=1 Tax=Trichonephila inaurata madagascariensis TaxID=2747483 RepID=A0A8X6XDJ8_9ARAC|nr:uncharacterized protein C9orf85 homolog [Trichonephila inaurata madagascariensis]
MSTQRGNVTRSRPQKHQNTVAFKNDKYGQTHQTKMLNAMKLSSLCSKCEGIIQWKIKFKKYKPLTVPAKCIKCEEKTVKSAYHNICSNCSENLNVCAKCGENFSE